jgi:predicted nucleotide-binding protein (sugar kinase/HSP70/actin superfamily)
MVDARTSRFDLGACEKQYWGYEEEVIGAGGYHLQSDVSGIISVIAFGCGPDSVMIEMLQRYARQASKPFMNLVIDEHTAEGGLATRVEAFVDMIRHKHEPKPVRSHSERSDSEEYKGIHALGLPNFANIAPAFRVATEMLGVRLIVPPVTRNTITLGARHSPEFVCLPFKMILGSFIEALNAGADTLFMVTSSNACRMGYYAKLQEQILRDLGYEFQFLKYKSAKKGVHNILRAVKSYTNNSPWLKVIAAYRLGTTKLKAIDDLERLAQKFRPVELERGQTDRLYQEAVRVIAKAPDLTSTKQAFRSYWEKIDQMPINGKIIPLKVGIVGELYVIMEPLVNMNLEVELGKRGAQVTRTRTTFFRYTKFPSSLNVLKKEKAKVQKFAQPYLSRDVGGHGLESVGEKVRLARDGYDGIVHVMPFTCMPEAIAQNVMLGTKEDIPVLNIVCDEQLEQVGMLTRIEAFVDTMEWRRKRSKLPSA